MKKKKLFPMKINFSVTEWYETEVLVEEELSKKIKNHDIGRVSYDLCDDLYRYNSSNCYQMSKEIHSDYSEIEPSDRDYRGIKTLVQLDGKYPDGEQRFDAQELDKFMEDHEKDSVEFCKHETPSDQEIEGKKI